MAESLRVSGPRLYGLIGEGIGYTLSPAIHSIVYREARVEAVYVAWDVPRHRVHLFIEALREASDGFNVTKPYKELVLHHCDGVSREVEETGAVNTVVVREARLECHNTDVLGVIECLRGTRGETALILGAGGAAKAVIAALARLGYRRVYISNRTRARATTAKAVAESLGLDAILDKWPPSPETVDQADLIVNATPLGTLGKGEPPIPWERVTPRHTLFDLVYRPITTSFLKRGLEKGAKVVDGLCMLIWQALYADKHWLGITPNIALYRTVREAIREKLET